MGDVEESTCDFCSQMYDAAGPSSIAEPNFPVEESEFCKLETFNEVYVETEQKCPCSGSLPPEKAAPCSHFVKSVAHVDPSTKEWQQNEKRFPVTSEEECAHGDALDSDVMFLAVLHGV